MKKVLFTLIVLPYFCFAQQFEIGVNGGFDFHSLPMNNPIAKQDKPIGGYVGGASADLLLPHSIIGVGADITQLSETNYIAPNYTLKIYERIANPLITPHVFYNYLWDAGNVYSYAGAMAGLAVARVGVNSFDYSGTSVSGYSTAYNSGIGYVAGLQAGFIFRLNKNIGIGGEAALRYVNYSYTPSNSGLENSYRYKLFYFPFVFGLKYFI